MSQVFQPSREQFLTLADVLPQLIKDGLVLQDAADQIMVTPRSRDALHLHPLEIVANAGLRHPQTGRALDLDHLTDWLATKAEQPIFHIDPLKMDVRGIASVMSFAFAQRHRILAVEVRRDEVVIASAEPFVSGWIDNLKHVLRREIRRVVINPADLRRYTVEFYQLANSVNKANAGRSDASVAVGNFEQLLELGNIANPDANDQHIVNIVDWLLQYAFDQRASDIHLEPRREICQV